MKTFESFQLKNLKMENRVVFPPMDLYHAKKDGKVTEDHLIHYATRAVGKVGLVIMEATAVMPNGRISDQCLGLWNDEQIDGMRQVANACHRQGSMVAVQLNHAGRKCAAVNDDPDYTVAPSPIAFDETYRTPREITKEEINEVVYAFRDAAKRALAAGFDAIEIHGAHGYLISEFLSPLTNHRTDEYGGSLENRGRFLKEVLEAVRTVWPKEKALLLRVSATDHKKEGMTPEQMVEIIQKIKHLVDIVHVSSGGVAHADIDVFPGYQIGLSEKIRHECEVPTITVGLIQDLDMTEEILGNGRADLVAMGRALFRNPYWVLQKAFEKGVSIEYPEIYEEAFLDKLR